MSTQDLSTQDPAGRHPDGAVILKFRGRPIVDLDLATGGEGSDRLISDAELIAGEL